MLLDRCSICGKEVFSPPLVKVWEEHISKVPERVLKHDFCSCKNPNTDAWRKNIGIDYRDLYKAIVETGKEIQR